jgi:hypothetical protein
MKTFWIIIITLLLILGAIATNLFVRLLESVSKEKIESEYILELVDQDSVRVYSDLSGLTQTVLFDSLEATIEKDNK